MFGGLISFAIARSAKPPFFFLSAQSFFSGQIPMSALPISAKSKKKKVADAVEPAELSELNQKKIVPTRLQKVYANCGKQLFIEKRSWFQIVRVFDRLVIFHVMAFQVSGTMQFATDLIVNPILSTSDRASF